jgi:selenocysteine-specific elongation factor
VLSERPGPLTVGTAGHVDHGKTALVATLTGVDTDRLPAEKARGLSIELGYAPLELPSGRRLSLIDVPGHERFIRTMVAGAQGIDLFMMVIAADDGARQQTREHAQILRALNITTGIVVITKTDLTDPATAVADARELLPDAPLVVCPAEPAERRVPVLAALNSVVQGLAGRAALNAPTVMHIDRVLTIPGAGTVVTGTLAAGRIERGDALTIYPRGRDARVRGVQIHGATVDVALAGQRVAVNLARTSRDDVARGDVLAVPGAIVPAHVISVTLDFEPPAARPHVVHAHHGTRATPARLRWPQGSDQAQLRCREPLLTRSGDRVVIRDAAGRETLGGATVTAAPPRRANRKPTLPIDRQDRARHAPHAPAGRDVPTVADEPPPPAALDFVERMRRDGAHIVPDAQLNPTEREMLPLLRERGLAVRIGHDRHVAAETIISVEAAIRTLIAEDGHVALPQLRDRLAVSREQAKTLLNYFDSTRVTIRRPDGHPGPAPREPFRRRPPLMRSSGGCPRICVGGLCEV